MGLFRSAIASHTQYGVRLNSATPQPQLTAVAFPLEAAAIRGYCKRLKTAERRSPDPDRVPKLVYPKRLPMLLTVHVFSLFRHHEKGKKNTKT